MKINQFLQVVLAGLIMSVGLQKLPARAFVLNSTDEDNSSFATDNNSAQSSDLSHFFTQTSKWSKNSITDCKNNGSAGGGTASTPEPTLITGLVLMTGLGIWSGRKKLISN